LPLFVIVADKGEIVCLPEIGLWKRANSEVVKYARWEAEGGFGTRVTSFRDFCFGRSYHKEVLKEVNVALEALDLPEADILDMKRKESRQLARHALYLLLGWKPRADRKVRVIPATKP
jgi:hypothetical protein